MSTKLSSLTIFFPFYNDAGTVERQIKNAYEHGQNFTKDLEVIAIHGGESSDNTYDEILRMKKKFPSLVVVDKSDNKEGYAVIKHGFSATTKDWIFYTDGDAQYHLEEDLLKLVEVALIEPCDVVNGYKLQRGDNVFRILSGGLYAKFSAFLFELPIRDVDCDFRLIKKSKLDKIDLVSKDSTILAEMVKKLDLVGAKFVEVPVSHYEREYGTSNYTVWQLAKEKLIGDLTLYFKLKKLDTGFSKLRVLRFAAVGTISIALQLTIFNLLLVYTQINPVAATFLSDQVSIVLSFVLNNFVTFRDRKLSGIAQILGRFALFYSIVIISTLLQTVIVFIGTSVFGTGILISNAFLLIGLFFAFLWNYTTQKRVVWSRKNG